MQEENLCIEAISLPKGESFTSQQRPVISLVIAHIVRILQSTTPPMRSSINYNKPHREADLFAKSEQRFGCFYPSRSSALSESPGEEKSISQSGLSSQSTVSSVKTENWVDNSDHLCFQSCAEAFPASADKLALLASVASHSAVDLQSTLKGVSENIDQATMATYLTGSNAQADALQTLYLMNPGYAGYGESPNPGNMVLLGPTAAMGQGSPLGNHGQQHQQPFVGFSVPSAITQSPLSHQPPASNTSIGLQNSSPNLFTGRLTSQGFNWGGGNELSFIPSSGVMEDGQQLAGGLNSVGPGQQSSDMSHYGLGSLPQTSFQEHAPLMPNGMGLGLNMGNMQSPTTAAAGQILSLSLSPQQSAMMPMQSFSIQPGGAGVNPGPGYTSAGVENNFTKADAFSNGLNMFRASYRENSVGTGFQNQVSGPGTDRQASITMSYSTVGGYGSKYLKAAQELLSEVVSVGKTTKNNTQQHTKLQSWMGPNSGSDVSFSKDSNYMEFTGKEGESVVGWRSVKDGEVSVTAVPTSTASIPEHNAEAVVDLTPAERQELQTKKAKLMAMRDEVDRRYKQYYHQMQIVVASFESAAGLGAAKTYTALPLQTISKHFRCLRDAITGQIKAASRALGEEEVKGETSRLRFVDQQLQQQRALRQLGMMQQHAWRPQRGLPERSVSILRAWLFEHFLHPYPKDADKILLARQTGLSRNQVSNWFINARVRLWKPMVEEMYLEEIKEGESEGADKADRDEGDMVGGDASSEGTKPLKQQKLSNTNNEGYQEQNNGSDQASDVLQGRQLLGSPPDGFLFHDKENTKKIRNGVHDSSSLLSPNAMTVLDFKPNEAHGEDILDHDIKIRSEDRHREHYGIVHGGFVQADNESLAGYVPFQVGGLNRYSQESLAAGYAANSAVSLTLGLQHCEGLSLSRAQQQYGQGHLQLAPGRVHEDGAGPPEYYSTNESSYGVINLQNRKPFPSHLVHHDFVA